ncbi:unnamed protein product [Cladocopium goreaui]|uniref:Protein-lysine methyltransferase METTL21B n=1 Tax=Cladocopium goreaui TaxID=2562237 RepID=A0A9P1BRA0_9DINO|nr:unnamed protein product [Cladocopium goreaui]
MNLALDTVLTLPELCWERTPVWTLALMLNHVMPVHLHSMNLLVISWNEAMTVQWMLVTQGARLSMPLDWGDSTVPVVDSTGSGIEQPAIPSVSCQQSFQFIRHTTDATYIQQRDKTLQCALQKWRFLVMLDPQASDVGRQLVGKDEQETELVLTSVMGVKSPNTVLKRANALLLYYRWNSVNGYFPMVPFNEEDIWRYVQEQTGRSSSASRSQSLIQGLRFAHFVMGFHGTLSCANSRRISGQAQIQLSLKAPVRQARPLTVAEVRTLHSIADGWSHSKVDKCIASTLLLMLYGRCRVSDVNYIHEILHDVSGSTGFLEVTTRYHKSARTAQQKALLMPILVGSVGVTAFPWIQAWISNRKACGLPTSRVVDGALMPAPLMGDSVQWLKRPLAPGEISGILKNFLKSSDENLTSHSLKATALSWAAKAEVPREQRRVLGRHAAAVQGSDTFYSRDLCVGPVNSLQKVVAMIRDQIFNPDASRSNYFAGSTNMSTGTPAHAVMQPFTPAYLNRSQPATPCAAPATPAARRSGEQRTDVLHADASVEVKEEPFWVLPTSDAERRVIEISSDSSGESSESVTCCDTSSVADTVDLEEEDCQEPHVEASDRMPTVQTLVMNTKTKIIHECRNSGDMQICEQSYFEELMLGSLTSCGRELTKTYKLVLGPYDWTAKCRICFKGRRAP